MTTGTKLTYVTPPHTARRHGRRHCTQHGPAKPRMIWIATDRSTNERTHTGALLAANGDTGLASAIAVSRSANAREDVLAGIEQALAELAHTDREVTLIASEADSAHAKAWALRHGIGFTLGQPMGGSGTHRAWNLARHAWRYAGSGDRAELQPGYFDLAQARAATATPWEVWETPPGQRTRPDAIPPTGAGEAWLCAQGSRCGRTGAWGAACWTAHGTGPLELRSTGNHGADTDLVGAHLAAITIGLEWIPPDTAVHIEAAPEAIRALEHDGAQHPDVRKVHELAARTGPITWNAVELRTHVMARTARQWARREQIRIKQGHEHPVTRIKVRGSAIPIARGRSTWEHPHGIKTSPQAGAGTAHRAPNPGARTQARRALAPDTIEAIATGGRSALRLTEAAALIGISRETLDRWEHEGLVQYTCTTPIPTTGGGTTHGRLWTPSDAKAIRDRVAEIEALDARNRKRNHAQSNARRAEKRWKPWSPEVLAQAEAAASSNDIERDNLRKIPFIAIDPPGARDRDDAVWCERRRNGWRVMVAIADVGARVIAGTALDHAIKCKGQTVYLPHTHHPMCPAVLSEHACSLHEGEDKLALVTALLVDENGHVQTLEAMAPARIRIARATCYASVRAEIEGQGNSTLGALGACAQALRTGRRRDNAIILGTPSEIDIELDNQGQPIRSRYRTMHTAHHAIEETMIAANVANARWLAGHGARGSLYRTHECPDWSAVAGTVDAARQAGAVLPRDADLHTTLAQVPNANGEASAYLDDLLRKILPKALYQAGTPKPHFALAEDVYAHTTSPIRRYADLRCQQWAHAVHGHHAAPEPEPELDSHLNTIERETITMEREATNRALAVIAGRREHRGWHSGRIASVLPWGVFVESSRIAGAQGLYHAREMRERNDTDEYIDMREWWSEGTEVQMRIVRADPRSGKIDVALRP